MNWRRIRRLLLVACTIFGLAFAGASWFVAAGLALVATYRINSV
jgi:hypothetical protein